MRGMTVVTMDSFGEFTGSHPTSKCFTIRKPKTVVKSDQIINEASRNPNPHIEISFLATPHYGKSAADDDNYAGLVKT